MLVLKSISLKNIIVYKEASFSIESGISVIRGENKTGKSLLFSTMGNVFFGTPPLEKKKGGAKLLHGKDSSIKICLNNSKITQYQKGKSVGYKIVKEGKKLHTHRISSAQNTIAKILGINETFFYSLCYINVFRNHPLLHGTSAHRYEFFEKLIDMSKYDFFYDKFSKIALLNKSLLKELSFVQSSIKELKPQIKHLHLKEEVVSLNIKYKNLVQKKNDIANDLQRLSADQALLKSLQTSFSKKSLKNKIETLSSKLIKFERQYEEFSQYEMDLERYKEGKEFNESIEKKLKEIPVYNKCKLDEKLEKIETKYENLKLSFEKLKENRDAYLAVKDRLHLLKHGTSTYESKVTRFKNRALVLKDQYKRLLNIDFVKCPTCFQKIKQEVLKDTIDTLKQEYIEKAEKYKKFSSLCLLSKQRDACKGLDFSLYKIIPDRLEKLEKKKESVQKKLELIHDRNILEAKLIEIKKPSEPKDFKDSEDIKKNIEKLKEKLSLYKNDLRCYNQIQTKNVKNIETKLSKFKKRDGKYNNKILDINERLQSIQSKYATSKHAFSQLQEARKQRDELKEKTKNAFYYNILSQAYSARGVRILQIENLANAFASNLNRYASLIFSEPIKFSVEVGIGKFNILAERNGRVSDIHLLSGSESRCFQLLCVLSLLPFIKKSERSNFIVLDETESAMDKKSRQMFTKEFLPKLQKLIPSVIVITPLSSNELYIEGAKEFRVKKINGISTIR